MAFTGVCTTEMCDISNGISEYEDLNAKVFGISGDNPFAQAAWAEKEGITIPLLSDYEHAWPRPTALPTSSSLPAVNLIMGGVAKRSAFVIDKAGIVQYAEVKDQPEGPSRFRGGESLAQVALILPENPDTKKAAGVLDPLPFLMTALAGADQKPKISSSLKKRLSSAAAASGESEAWQTLRILASASLKPKSPRMVPGAAAIESVGPSRSRTLEITSSPSRARAMTGVSCMKLRTEGKKGLSAMCA
jgi:peroxiredoxin